MCFIHSVNTGKVKLYLGWHLIEWWTRASEGRTLQAEGSVTWLAFHGPILVGLMWPDTSRIVLQKNKLACPFLVRRALHAEESGLSAWLSAAQGCSLQCWEHLALGTFVERYPGATKPSKLITQQPRQSHRMVSRHFCLSHYTLSTFISNTEFLFT